MGSTTGDLQFEARRRVLPITGTVQYLEMDDVRGIHVSVHAPAGHPGEIYVTGLDRARDYRAIRLDAARILRLRDALDLALEDLSLSLSPPTPPIGA